MLILEPLPKQERKKQTKTIEKYLKNYKFFLAAISNLKRKIEYSKTLNKNSLSNDMHLKESASHETKLHEYQFLVKTIDYALEQLNEIEKNFIKYRYFESWSINKCAIHLRYSDKSLFLLRNQIMDKLIISLSSLL